MQHRYQALNKQQPVPVWKRQSISKSITAFSDGTRDFTMTPAEFRSVLRQTLDDRKVSRSERKALAAVFEEIRPVEKQLDLYRHEAFEVAREASLEAIDQGAVIEWLEDIVRLLEPAIEDGNLVTSEACFSPGPVCRHRIRSLLRQSRFSVEICVFTITDNEITEAIAECQQRGLRVRIITDDEKSSDIGSDIARLAKLGVEVRHDNSPYHMHHKFAIFDERLLLSGSYNWTLSAAEYNEENIVIQNDRHLVKVFRKVFEELWERYQSLT